MEKQPKYLARYDKVWRKKHTEKLLGAELTLEKDETLDMYEQIPKPKEESKEKGKDGKNIKGPLTLNKPDNN